MLLEKVLRRLCPCYYAQTDENEVLCSPNEDRKECSSENLPATARYTEGTVGFPGNGEGDVGNENFGATEYWGGSFDLVNPQPLYALPSENDKTTQNKSLLKPPLYWKKTKKNLAFKAPVVVQDRSKKKMNGQRSEVSGKRKHPNPVLALKHSETMADVRSVTSVSKNASCLKSQSLHDLPMEGRSSLPCLCKDGSHLRDERRSCRVMDNGMDTLLRYKNLNEICPQNGLEKYTDDLHQSMKKFRVIPDISYGVIVFSAVYSSSKRLLTIRIDRMENLSLKGRNGNTYNTVIKLSVSPPDKYVKSTKVLRKSALPDVKEDFSFTVKENSGKFLKMSVFDAAAQNPSTAIGHALLNLNGVMSCHTKKFRMKLYRHTQVHVTPGNLALAMRYHRDDEKFTVLVDKAKNLTLQKDKNVKLNTYVKATLYAHGNKLKSKKGVLVTNSKDPRYNSTFTFCVTDNDIDDLLLVMSVRLKSFVKDATIGRVILGPFFITDHKRLTPWGRVFLKQEIVSHWFRLYI